MWGKKRIHSPLLPLSIHLSTEKRIILLYMCGMFVDFCTAKRRTMHVKLLLFGIMLFAINGDTKEKVVTVK